MRRSGRLRAQVSRFCACAQPCWGCSTEGKLDHAKNGLSGLFTLSLGGVVDVEADDHSVVFRRVDRGDQPLHFGKLRRPGHRAVEHCRGVVARLQARLRSSEL
eukprot:2336466-Prymnesium_polylepis.1